MPTYLFRCEYGHDEEKTFKMNEVPLMLSKCKHINCVGYPKRVPCTTSFVLKGSDWPGRDIKKGQS